MRSGAACPTTTAATTTTPDSRSLYKSKMQMQIAPLCVNRRTDDLNMHYACDKRVSSR